MGILVYNHIHHGIYLRIEFYPNLIDQVGLSPLIKWVSLSKILEIFKLYFIENMIFGVNCGCPGNYNQNLPQKTYFQLPWKYWYYVAALWLKHQPYSCVGAIYNIYITYYKSDQKRYIQFSLPLKIIGTNETKHSIYTTLYF